jgi:hypothetical protein
MPHTVAQRGELHRLPIGKVSNDLDALCGKADDADGVIAATEVERDQPRAIRTQARLWRRRGVFVQGDFQPDDRERAAGHSFFGNSRSASPCSDQ